MFVVPGQWVVIVAVRRIARLVGFRCEEESSNEAYEQWALEQEAAALAEKNTRVWRTPEGPMEESSAPAGGLDRLATLSAHTWWVRGLAFSPDGRVLASASTVGKRSLVLWDVSHPSRPNRLAIVRGAGSADAVAFSPDGHILATALNDYQVGLWNVRDPRRPVRVATFAPDCGALNRVTFSPDGRLLATGSWDLRDLRLWDVSDPAHPAPRGTLSGVVKDRPEWPTGHVFSPDGKILVTTLRDELVDLWDLAEPSHLAPSASLPVAGEVLAMAFRPDGRILVTAGAAVTVWDMADPTEPRELTVLRRGKDFMVDVAFTPDGRTLAVTSPESGVFLWDMGDPSRPVDRGLRVGEADGISYLTFSPDGRVLATSDGVHGEFTVTLWAVP